ncbi:hypothetical protein BH10PLA2_BH10PLA2_39450 [soil metagenome]
MLSEARSKDRALCIYRGSCSSFPIVSRLPIAARFRLLVDSQLLLVPKTPFGNVFPETLFREPGSARCTTRKTEFQAVGSQMEFGIQEDARWVQRLVAVAGHLTVPCVS